MAWNNLTEIDPNVKGRGSIFTYINKLIENCIYLKNNLGGTGASGDMYKSEYDPSNTGRVLLAEGVDDGITGNWSTAEDIANGLNAIPGKVTNPMTTLGDLIVGGVGGVPTRKGIGAANKKIFVNAAGNGYEFDTGIYQGSFTIDTSLTSGSIDITVVPFKPCFGKFNAVINSTLQVSWGDDDGTANRKCLLYNLTVFEYSGSTVYLIQSAGVYHVGYISAWLSNGFTYTWTKAGAKTGTAFIFYTLHR